MLHSHFKVTCDQGFIKLNIPLLYLTNEIKFCDKKEKDDS